MKKGDHGLENEPHRNLALMVEKDKAIMESEDVQRARGKNGRSQKVFQLREHG